MLCNGGSTGSVDITVTGGTSPYTYSWLGGSTDEDLTFLTAGTYEVLATDANGCTIVGNFTIIESSAITIDGVVVDVLCNGGSDGSVNITVTGGTSPYTYSWLGGSTDEDLTGLIAGTYEVIVTDANGCTLNASFVISEPILISLTASITDVLCYGYLTGEIDLAVSGGTSPYIYSWTTADASANIVGLGAGSYGVTIIDDNGCQIVETFDVVQNDIISVTSSISDVSCNGNNDGAIDITIIGGITPYSFDWSNNESTEDVSELVANNYSVVVTDVNGCMVSAYFDVIEPDELNETSAITDVLCFGGNNGGVNLIVTGGTLPYSYNWSNSVSTEDINGVVAGDYDVTITDANNCFIVNTYTINEPTGLSLSGVTVDVLCYEGANGSIDLTVIGGTSPYLYEWSNGYISEDLEFIVAGTYDIIVTDANGCTETATFIVGEPVLIVVTAQISNVLCYGGSDGNIDVSISGGSLPYTYLWSNSEITQDLLNVTAGTYELLVTDAQGCTSFNIYEVLQPSQISVLSNIVNVDCNTSATGEVNIYVSGGTMPYTYLWSNGETTQDINGLAAGTYAVTITDTHNCISYFSFEVTQPNALNVTTYLSWYGSYNVSINGASDGFIVLLPEGGTFPYTYLWDNGETTYYQVWIGAGTYSVTVTDMNGCSEVVYVTLIEPPVYVPLVLENIVISDYYSYGVSCNGAADGTIDVTLSGGTSPLSYVWSNGSVNEDLTGLVAGFYTLTVTDAIGDFVTTTVEITEPTGIEANPVVRDVRCIGSSDGEIDLTISGGFSPYLFEWSNGETTEDIIGLDAGDYYVTITDDYGCFVVEMFIVSDPDPFEFDFVVIDPTCVNDGSVDLYVSGGVAPYTYVWSNGYTGEDLTNIGSGIYDVIVTDSVGCTTSGSVEVSGAFELQLSYAYGDVSCNGLYDGFIELDVNGGTAPYSFNWNNGKTTEDIDSLAAGTYTITLNDYNGCEIIEIIEIIETDVIEVNAAITNVNCSEGNDGAIDITISGGVVPYTVAWGNNVVTEDMENLVAGIYNVTVTDSNGCTSIESFEVFEPNPISLTYNLVMVSCYKADDGAIDIIVAGGVGPYSFVWTNGEIIEDIGGLKAGLYRVEIIDANGCAFLSDFITITQPDAIVSYIDESSPISCFGDVDGEIDLSVSGGSTPYTYVWSNSSNTQDLINLGEGLYTVTITDANGCMVLNAIDLNAPDLFIDQMYSVDPSCYGVDDGSVGIAVNGGTYPYSFEWDNGISIIGYDETVENLFAGSYNVTATDAHGCTVIDAATIIEPDEIVITLQTTVFNGVDAVVTANVTGGSGAGTYSYLWQPSGIASYYIKNVMVGQTLTLVVTDENGCSEDTTFIITATYPTTMEYMVLDEIVDTELDDVIVYPNPNNTGIFFIELSNMDYSTLSLDVYDSYGKLVRNSKVSELMTGHLQVNLNNVQKGLYYLRITGQDQSVITKKLIITQ